LHALRNHVVTALPRRAHADHLDLRAEVEFFDHFDCHF